MTTASLPTPLLRLGAWVQVLPGIAVLALFAMVAQWVAGGLGEPLSRNPVLVAMLLGLLIGNVSGYPERLRPGLDFTKRYLLRGAVVLIGFRVTVRLLPDLGLGPLVVAAVELLAMLFIVNWVAMRVFRLDRNLSLLLACGTAICGAAAILSVSAMTRARTQQTGMAVTLITLFGSLALLVYPIAFLNGWMPGIDDEQYGVFVGASIYELAQVYGSSYAVSEMALNTATLVKLAKVLLLIPVLLALKYGTRGDRSAKIPFPWFIVGFIGVMLLNSSVTLHPVLRATILDVDLFLFLMVMFAVGLDTRFARLRDEGGALKLVGLGLFTLVLSASLSYALVRQLAPSGTSTAPSGSPAESAMLASPGGKLFSTIGCAKCHVPSMPTQGGAAVTLYSDLLLHDMGAALDDKLIQGDATGRDWRTAPLVGLSMRKRYLHDGRAQRLNDAILAHEGEGAIVRDRYFDLNEQEQQLVLEFLGRL